MEEVDLNIFKQEFGSNKRLITDYELPLLIALAHYPELRNTRISFRFKRNSGAALADFKLFSALKRRRHYVITFNDDHSTTGVIWKDAPLNAQIGLAGHELSHVAELQRLSNLGVLWWGLRYITSKKQHKKFERKTDQSTIDHGLGWQLYDWNNYAISSSATSDKYRLMKKTFYLSPQEIQAQLAR